MLSYRHGFHAGNFADVIKHLTLVAILDYLNRKPKPYGYIDTHAGAGCYPIHSPFMQKNKEYLNGISQLQNYQAKHPVIKQYLSIIQQFNPQHELSVYPGSPSIAQRLLRDDDYMHLFECHPQEVQLLKACFKQERQVKVHALDVYQSLLAFMPPKTKRGLVLIDPSYEHKAEYQHVLDLLRASLARFNTGIFIVWYPVIDHPLVKKFVRQMQYHIECEKLHVEFCMQTEMALLGSGLFIFNPPYTLREQLKLAFLELQSVFTEAVEFRLR